MFFMGNSDDKMGQVLYLFFFINILCKNIFNKCIIDICIFGLLFQVSWYWLMVLFFYVVYW